MKLLRGHNNPPKADKLVTRKKVGCPPSNAGAGALVYAAVRGRGRASGIRR